MVWKKVELSSTHFTWLLATEQLPFITIKTLTDPYSTFALISA